MEGEPRRYSMASCESRGPGPRGPTCRTASGTKELNDRPGLAALIDRLESNGVRVVLVERANRLARDLMVSEVILDQFARIGARVLTADSADITSAADNPTPTPRSRRWACLASVSTRYLCLYRSRMIAPENGPPRATLM